MFMSPGEMKRRKEELERQRGITPKGHAAEEYWEMKRYNEIKAGVITGTVGLGIAIFLYVFMQGIILSGNVTPNAAEILSRLWIAGVLPLFVGISLIVNGLFVSRKLVEIAKQNSPNAFNNSEDVKLSLEPADATSVVPSGFSVTDHTTKHLTDPGRKQ